MGTLFIISIAVLSILGLIVWNRRYNRKCTATVAPEVTIKEAVSVELVETKPKIRRAKKGTSKKEVLK